MAEGLAQLWHLYLGPDYAAFKVYHYEKGTTTNKTVWVDSTKITAAAQPVVADVNGWISFYADGDYRFDVKDSDGVLLKSLDGVRVTQDQPLLWEGSHGSSLPAIAGSQQYWQLFAKHSAGNLFDRVKIATPDGWADLVSFAGNGIFDITSYAGTTGDGVTLDTVGIRAAYAAAAAAGGGIVLWPAGNYVMQPDDRVTGIPSPIITLGSDNIYTVGYGATLRVQSTSAKNALTSDQEFTFSYAFMAKQKSNIGFFGLNFDGDRNLTGGSAVNPRMGLFTAVQCDNVVVRECHPFDCDAYGGAIRIDAIDATGVSTTVVQSQNIWIEKNLTERCWSPITVNEACAYVYVRDNISRKCDAYFDNANPYASGTLVARGIRFTGFIEEDPAVSGGSHDIIVADNFVEGTWGIELWNNDGTYGNSTSAAGYFTDITVTGNTLETLWGISTNTMGRVLVAANNWHKIQLNSADQVQDYVDAGGHVSYMRLALGSGPFATIAAATPANAKITVTLPTNVVAVGHRIDITGASGGNGLTAGDLNQKHWILTKPTATTATFVCGTLDTATATFSAASATVTLTGSTNVTAGDYISFPAWSVNVYEVLSVVGTTMTLTGATSESTTRANVPILIVKKPSGTGSIGGSATIAYDLGENFFSIGIEAQPLYYSTVVDNTVDCQQPTDHFKGFGILTGVSDHNFLSRANKISNNHVQGSFEVGMKINDCEQTEISYNTFQECAMVFREELAWDETGQVNFEVTRTKNIFKDNTIYHNDAWAQNINLFEFPDPSPAAAMSTEWTFENNTIYYKYDQLKFTYPFQISNADASLRFIKNRFIGFKGQAVFVIAATSLEFRDNKYESGTSATGHEAIRITRADGMAVSASNETVKGCDGYMLFTGGSQTFSYRIDDLHHDGNMQRPFYGSASGDQPAGINFGPAGGIRTMVIEMHVAGASGLTVNNVVPGPAWIFGITGYVWSAIDATISSTLDLGDSVGGQEYWCNDSMDTTVGSKSDVGDFATRGSGAEYPVLMVAAANLTTRRSAGNFNSTGIILATIKYLPLDGLSF